MLELNIQINEMMNYNINIPRVITPQTFPEILKRLKSVISIIPEEDIRPHKKGSKNPVTNLGLQESKDLLHLYKTLPKTEFSQHLSSEYKIELGQVNIVAIMGRLKERIILFNIKHVRSRT